jgi:hypothetical protein
MCVTASPTSTHSPLSVFRLFSSTERTNRNGRLLLRSDSQDAGADTKNHQGDFCPSAPRPHLRQRGGCVPLRGRVEKQTIHTNHKETNGVASPCSSGKTQKAPLPNRNASKGCCGRWYEVVTRPSCRGCLFGWSRCCLVALC